MSNETPKESEAENSAEDAEAEETPKAKTLGLIPMIAAGVVAAGVAGGAAFVLTPGAEEENAACIEAAGGHGGDEHGAESNEQDAAALAECEEQKLASKEKKKKAGKSHGGGHGGQGGENAKSDIKPLGEIQHSQHATFVVMDPMVVSISPIGRSKHLKISLVLETDDDGAEQLLENGFYVQDVLNTFLRSIGSEVLEDPAAMSRLRAQILRRVRAIVPDANVQNVLITEFVLT
ncbi:flagellar basal body-associated FliL family protein [Hyphococcus luteus]|uniref:flagellar basal body-associated FliL family protein n=1 Tax=Hyphococcus luteus TaxID=2058213 RepID=UPI0010570D2C|nr:flagellar basal body-associated FliL family protein [Marinicaulis flavus]